jgi:threonine aldolase
LADAMPAPFIDLRSDTVTKPTPEMRRTIANAEVGDDMIGEDPTVNRLEVICAERFGKAAAVLACSGTQANQMAVRAHCLPGDELLIHESGHIANYEAGGPAVLSGVSTRTLTGPHGLLDLDTVRGTIRGRDQHLVRTRLLCLENTTNVGGGRAYPLERIAELCGWAREHGLRAHLDGARLFNACIARGYSPADVAVHFDTVAVCFSKGLGCPMGSILVGDTETIAHARRSRKLFGGALRQSGMFAAAAIHAMEHHVDRLAEDHANAQLLAESIAGIDGIRIDPAAVETNLVFFEVDPRIATAHELQTALETNGLRVYAMGPTRLRACTHLDVTGDDVRRAAEIVGETVAAGVAAKPGASGPYEW